MNYERQKRLVERLLERTQGGTLSWQEGVDDDTFQVSFPNNSVQIAFLSDHRKAYYRISIIDSAGRLTENFDDSQLNEDGSHYSGSWSYVLRDLFNLARRNALKADEVLDKILSEIG